MVAPTTQLPQPDRVPPVAHAGPDRTDQSPHLGLRMLLASASYMPTVFCSNWLDVLRARAQFLGQSPLRVARDLYVAEGAGGIALRGVRASLSREFLYAGFRVGLYEPVRDVFARWVPQATEGSAAAAAEHYAVRLAAGAACGALGSLVSNPLDRLKTLAHVRELGTPEEGVPAALRRIGAEGGRAALWRGVVPAMQKAAVVTSVQLSTYDELKHALLARGVMAEGPLLHLACAASAACACILTSSPLDVAKTLIMADTRPGAVRAYRGVAHCLLATARAGGVRALYRGASVSSVRLLLHSLIAFECLEVLHRAAGLPPL